VSRRYGRAVRARHLVALTLLGLAVIGGCGTDSAGVSTGSTAAGGDVTADDLDGRTFVSTQVDGYALVSGTAVTLSFQNGTLSASTGCNTMNGAVTIEDSKLRADQLASTLIGCPDGLAAQDEWLSGFLQAGPTLALDGSELTMTSGSVTITLVDESVGDPARSLVGSAWTLDGIIEGQTVSSVPTGVEAPFLQIGEDGVAAISTGCNRGSAAVGTNGSTLSFGPLRLTKMACPPDTAGVEGSVVAVIDGDVTFTIEGARLTLTKGEEGLVYRAA
jgi:heat shock protein HslJ